MKYMDINGLKKPLSVLVYGTATPIIFRATKENASDNEKKEAYELLDNVFAAGINVFDCAAHYGEEVLGEWMEKRQNRDDCIVITKCAHPNKWRSRVTSFDILADVHDSLKKLKTDYIDIYMLHRDNTETPVEIIVDTLNQLYHEGKIKVFGGSNWTCQRIEAANEYALKHNLIPFRISSPNFGLAEQIADPWKDDAKWGNGCVTISGPENEPSRKWYVRHDMPVIAYSSLAHGFFSGAFQSREPEKALLVLDGPGITGYFCDNNLERLRRCEELAEEKGCTVAQIALAWLFRQPLKVFALTSPTTQEQLMQSIEALDISLTPAESKWLDLK